MKNRPKAEEYTYIYTQKYDKSRRSFTIEQVISANVYKQLSYNFGQKFCVSGIVGNKGKLFFYNYLINDFLCDFC